MRAYKKAVSGISTFWALDSPDISVSSNTEKTSVLMIIMVFRVTEKMNNGIGTDKCYAMKLRSRWKNYIQVTQKKLKIKDIIF
jgi:hypothetical protein